MTQRVDRARQSGLVRRLPAEAGSRIVVVELTERGHREVGQAVGSLLSYEQGLVDVLDPAQQEELASLLTILLASLAERQRQRHEPPGSGTLGRGQPDIAGDGRIAQR